MIDDWMAIYYIYSCIKDMWGTWNDKQSLSWIWWRLRENIKCLWTHKNVLWLMMSMWMLVFKWIEPNQIRTRKSSSIILHKFSMIGQYRQSRCHKNYSTFSLSNVLHSIPLTRVQSTHTHTWNWIVMVICLFSKFRIHSISFRLQISRCKNKQICWIRKMVQHTQSRLLVVHTEKVEFWRRAVAAALIRRTLNGYFVFTCLSFIIYKPIRLCALLILLIE